MPTATSPTTYADLIVWSETVDDLERTRVAMAARISAMAERQIIDLPMQTLLVQIMADEATAIKALEKSMKQHVLGPWVERQIGVGLKQGARLLGTIDDPAARPNVAKLWAYCGLHVTEEGRAPANRRGVQSNWNTKAKARAWLIAQSCIKHSRSPYRATYERARAKYQGASHTFVCRNTRRYTPFNGCGTAEHPEWGEIGSPLRDGHVHANAMRLTAKAILKDLWIEARVLAGLPTDALGPVQ